MTGEMTHDLMIYLRLMAYLFLAYSLFSLAIAKWTVHRDSAMVHIIFACMFLIGAVVLIVTRLLPITDYAHLVLDIMDFVITPLLLFSLVYIWKILIKQEQEKVRKIEDRINGNNCLVPDTR